MHVAPSPLCCAIRCRERLPALQAASEKAEFGVSVCFLDVSGFANRRVAEISFAGVRTAQLLEPQRRARGRFVAEAVPTLPSLDAEKVTRWSGSSASPTGQSTQQLHPSCSSDCGGPYMSHVYTQSV